MGEEVSCCIPFIHLLMESFFQFSPKCMGTVYVVNVSKLCLLVCVCTLKNSSQFWLTENCYLKWSGTHFFVNSNLASCNMELLTRSSISSCFYHCQILHFSNLPRSHGYRLYLLWTYTLLYCITALRCLALKVHMCFSLRVVYALIYHCYPPPPPPGFTRGIGGDLSFRNIKFPPIREWPVVKSPCSMAANSYSLWVENGQLKSRTIKCLIKGANICSNRVKISY